MKPAIMPIALYAISAAFGLQDAGHAAFDAQRQAFISHSFLTSSRRDQTPELMPLRSGAYRLQRSAQRQHLRAVGRVSSETVMR